MPARYSGGKGSAMLACRVPQEVMLVLERIHAFRPHDYPTVSDVVRVALKVGADQLELDQGTVSSLAVLDASAAVLENDLLRERGTDQIDKLCLAVTDLRGRGQAGRVEAEALVARVVSDITRIGSPFWKDELLRQVERTVRPLLAPRNLSLLALVRSSEVS